MTEERKSLKNSKPASTVILTQQHSGEIQVYLLKRSIQSGFFPGTYVFPGGEVDPEDRIVSLWMSNLDIDLEEISQRFNGGMTEEEAIAHGVTAIRETFEEAGVLLCYHNEPGQGNMERVCARRMDRDLPKRWLKDLVVSEGWSLEFSRLGRWAHWITPELMPRRYETRFFLAFMPAGQECIPDFLETTEGIWVTPEKGLAGNLQGEIPLSPPTLITLHELLQYSNLGDLEKETKTRQWGEALLPRMIPSAQGALILEPWDPMYNQKIEIDMNGLQRGALPLGESFSRLWYHKGIWRPVRS